MIVTLALYIILGIVALIVLALAVRVRITLEIADELMLTLRVFGINYQIRPKKQKKYKISDYTLKKIAKRDRKKAIKDAKKAEAKAQRQAKRGNGHALTKEQKKAKRSSRPPVADLVSIFISTIRAFFPSLLFKFHFHIARIKIKVGGEDAARIALTYYAISNAITPALHFIEKHSHLHGVNKADIEIAPDFLSEEIKADIKLSFSTSIGGLLGVLLKTFFKFIGRYFKIKSGSPSSTSSTPQDKNQNEKIAEASQIEMETA